MTTSKPSPITQSDVPAELDESCLEQVQGGNGHKTYGDITLKKGYYASSQGSGRASGNVQLSWKIEEAER